MGGGGGGGQTLMVIMGRVREGDTPPPQPARGVLKRINN